MSFHDPRSDLAGERTEEVRRAAGDGRLVDEAQWARSRRRRWDRRRRVWRRALAPRLAATIRAVNDVIGAIISPGWPTQDEQVPPPLRPSPGR